MKNYKLERNSLKQKRMKKRRRKKEKEKENQERKKGRKRSTHEMVSFWNGFVSV